jgi:uncharacterized protein (TIGR02246 family)
MKLAFLLCASAFTFALSLTGCQQAPSPAAFAKTNETEIRQFMDAWTKAFDAADVTAISALYDPKVLAYDVVPPLQYDGKDAYMKDYAGFFSMYQGPAQVEVRDLRITTAGDIAFITCLERVSGTLKNGTKVSTWLRVTSGLHKVDGKWLDMHDHASVPADFATGKAQLDLQP